MVGAHMISVEEHLGTVLAATCATDSERMPVAGLRGRTLAEAVTAQLDIPLFDNSAMDGFAVRFGDVATASAQHPVTLRVTADLPAGSALDPPLRSGEAARIMTGAAVPTDADVIVPFEHTAGGLADSLAEVTVVQAPPGPGTHLRRRGDDSRAGAQLVAAGTELTPFALAAIAAAGVTEVAVHRTPRAAVISTGSELVAPGAPLRRGQIPESNSTLLAAAAAAAGADVVLRTSVPDDNDALHAAITDACAHGADIILFSGGVSAGAYEVVKTALGGAGEATGQMSFTSVAMQPGKPQGFGVHESGALMFGLPGNPVSAAVSFEVFVRPALLKLQGRTELFRPSLSLPAAASWQTPPARRQYLPVVIDRGGTPGPPGWAVRPATSGGSGSHLTGGLAHAEALAVVPTGIHHIEPGDIVDVMLLH